ncbi:hypothetical protein TWF481_000880 [Arthrobotrys musiformis]|uniref:Uncharacterized protein n=1 Tax=Arthrobotrys musiformis TaxID=47236 RepID=A0AAV9WPS9_9PEZI
MTATYASFLAEFPDGRNSEQPNSTRPPEYKLVALMARTDGSDQDAMVVVSILG